MISIKALTYHYPLSTQKALNGVTLEIPPGTLTLVTGASGSGKSTLLRCINGLVPHFSGGNISGQVRVFGSDPVTEGVEVMAEIVGFVFQEPEAQFVFDTVEDEIAFSLENLGISKVDMDQRIGEVLAELHISELRYRRINEISGGEQQKVAIASTLVMRPRVLILDEPTSQLDPQSADQLLKFILELKTRLNLTILISEHRLERLLPYADLMVNLTAEQSVLFGHPQQVLEKMVGVPPIIEIAKKLAVSPLPLTPEAFPEHIQNAQLSIKKQNQTTPIHQQERVLSIQRLSTSLDDRPILKDINIDICRGEILVLMGLNGAGKTTLLRSILKLIPSTGTAILTGVDMNNMHFSDIIQKIAYLPQNPNDLLFAESVIDELKITLKNHNIEANDTDLSAFLDNFGLTDKAHRYPRDLSVGERQRTALAAITVQNPAIIFMDEPTRGLDYQGKQALSVLFHQWRKQGKALLIVTHDVEFAAHLADRVVILAEGKIIFDGSPQEGLSAFPAFRTQTAQLFPGTGWITPDDIPKE